MLDVGITSFNLETAKFDVFISYCWDDVGDQQNKQFVQQGFAGPRQAFCLGVVQLLAKEAEHEGLARCGEDERYECRNARFHGRGN